MFISWMLITPSFKKSLIVEQFQGNYLKRYSLEGTYFKILWAFDIMLIFTDWTTKIKIIHFAVRMVSRCRRNVGSQP